MRRGPSFAARFRLSAATPPSGSSASAAAAPRCAPARPAAAASSAGAARAPWPPSAPQALPWWRRADRLVEPLAQGRNLLGPALGRPRGLTRAPTLSLRSRPRRRRKRAFEGRGLVASGDVVLHKPLDPGFELFGVRAHNPDFRTRRITRSTPRLNGYRGDVVRGWIATPSLPLRCAGSVRTR